MLTDAEFERFYRDNRDKIKIKLVDRLEFDRTIDEVLFFREPFKTKRHKCVCLLRDLWMRGCKCGGR